MKKKFSFVGLKSSNSQLLLYVVGLQVTIGYKPTDSPFISKYQLAKLQKATIITNIYFASRNNFGG